MEQLKVFTSKYVEELGQRLKSQDTIHGYIEGKVPSYSESDIKNTGIQIEKYPELSPDKTPLENSQLIFVALQSLDRTTASDQRLWSWLSHVPLMSYMSKKWKVEEQSPDKQASFILQKWFVQTQTGRSYLRSGLSSLWWGAFMTYDEKRDDPFELTREFFEYYNETTVFSDSLGKSKIFLHSLLDFIIQNPEYFKEDKRKKFRSLIRRLNFIGAYRLLPSLDEKMLRKILQESIL